MSQILNAPKSAKELHILKYYVNGLKDEEKFDCLQKAGFLDLVSKCALRADASFDSFSADIERVSENQKYQRGTKEYRAVAELKRDWRRELKIIRKCIDCYAIWTTSDVAKDYFTLVCTRPHLLVFIKEVTEGIPRLWPAKVVSVNNDDKIVSVECFGDYLQAEYKFTECYLYSATHKLYAKYGTHSMQHKYNRSFQEVKKYIENIKKKFGRFVPAAAKVTIRDVDVHLTEMYPGFFERTPAKETLENSPSRSTGYASQSTSVNAVSIKTEQTLEIETGSTRNENRKRKMVNTSATDPAHKANKVSDGSEIGNSSQANDEVIVIDYEDPDVNENIPNSSQSRNEPSASGRSCQAMLDEFCIVTRKIHQFETQLNLLKEQESIIRAKFNESVMGNVDGKLVELSDVTKKILECEQQLANQKDEEQTIIAKIKSLS